MCVSISNVKKVVYMEGNTGVDQSDDLNAQRDGLPQFPKLIFLDTNMVQNLHVFGELVYDRRSSPEAESKLRAKGARFADDIRAMADFVALGIRAGWPIAVSSRTLQELDATPQRTKRHALTALGKEFATYFASSLDNGQTGEEGSAYSEIRHFTFIQRCRLSDLLKVMPQEEDRQLVIDAIECGCDIFLTMDYKTIWRHRQVINRLGIKVMRPTELLEYVQPWVALIR